jgi:nucleotide-binding universal stress UspA family protein
MDAIQDVVAFVDCRPAGAGILEYARRLSLAHAAHLTGVFVWPPVTSGGPADYARGRAIHDLVAHHQTDMTFREKSLREPFEAAAKHSGLATEWRSVRDFRGTELVAHARYADLTIVGRPDVATTDSIPFALPETLVLASGRPVLLLPPNPQPSGRRRVLVGWNAGREATRAVADALPFLVKAETVEVLVVDCERNSASHGKEPGADIARHLARHGVEVEVRRMSSGSEDVGRLLLARAAAFGADLLVMGAYGHSRFTELVFGGATRTALHEAPLPVLMSR